MVKVVRELADRARIRPLKSSFSYPPKGKWFLEGYRESVSQQCTGPCRVGDTLERAHADRVVTLRMPNRTPL